MSLSELVVALERARGRTEDLLEPLSDEQLTRQISPLQSPLVWDLAHIGHFEELWTRGRTEGDVVGARRPLAASAADCRSCSRKLHARIEAGRVGLRVESWWTDRAGDFFAVALVLRDAVAGS